MLCRAYGYVYHHSNMSGWTRRLLFRVEISITFCFQKRGRFHTAFCMNAYGNCLVCHSHTLLYLTIPYHTLPCFIIPYHNARTLDLAMLYRTSAYHTLPYCSLSYNALSHVTTLYYTIPYAAILYYTLQYLTIPCHASSYLTITHTP